MNENEYIDDSFLENIEGLLFSEEYADAKDNESLISEIAHSELSGECDKTSEETEDCNEKRNDANCTPGINNYESILSIDETEDSLTKDFELFAKNDFRSSLKKNIISKFTSFNAGKSNHSIRKGLYTEPLRDSVDKTANNWHSSINPNESDNLIRNNFGLQSLSNFTEEFRGINIPFIGLEKTKFSIRDGFWKKILTTSEKEYKGAELPSAIAIKTKADTRNCPWKEDNQRSVENSKRAEPISIDKESKKNIASAEHSYELTPYDSLKIDKTSKQDSENTQKNKAILKGNQNLNHSYVSDKTKFTENNACHQKFYCKPIKLDRTFVESKKILNDHQDQESFCNSAKACEVEKKGPINQEIKNAAKDFHFQRTFSKPLKALYNTVDFSTNLSKTADKVSIEEKAVHCFTKNNQETKQNPPNTAIQKKIVNYTESKEKSNCSVNKTGKKNNQNEINHFAKARKKTSLVYKIIEKSKKLELEHYNNSFSNPSKLSENTTIPLKEDKGLAKSEPQNNSKCKTKNRSTPINQKKINSILFSIQRFHKDSFESNKKKGKCIAPQRVENFLLKMNSNNSFEKKTIMTKSNDVEKKFVSHNETMIKFNKKKGLF